MKRSSYFISARSESADLLASELILALADQYQRLDGYCVQGEWTGRTRSNRIGDLALSLRLGLHDQEHASADAQAYEGEILRALEEHPVNLAILVGYSYFHHRLAAYFKKSQIPVVLYEITPNSALSRIDASEVKERVDVALGITPQASDFVQRSGLPYHYIGSPHKDRVDRVIVEASSLGLRPDLPLVSLFPGARVEGLRDSAQIFEGLAARLSQNPKVQVVLSLAENLAKDLKVKEAELAFFIDKAAKSSYRVVVGMHLELLALSQLAVCGCGAITVECGLLQVPALALYPTQSGKNGARSLINQTMGRPIIKELAVDTPLDALHASAIELMEPGASRSSMLQEMQELTTKLQGFAAENAAAYIGREIGQWQLQQRKSKDSKTA